MNFEKNWGNIGHGKLYPPSPSIVHFKFLTEQYSNLTVFFLKYFCDDGLIVHNKLIFWLVVPHNIASKLKKSRLFISRQNMTVLFRF